MINIIITCGNCEEFSSEGSYYPIKNLDNWIIEYDFTKFEMVDSPFFSMFTCSVAEEFDIDEFINFVKQAGWKRLDMVSVFIQTNESEKFKQVV